MVLKALPERLLRRLTAAAAAVVATTGAGGAAAQATLSSQGHAPIELRTAIASAAGRTTLWTQVHATTEAGGFALVVPAASGAGLDLATDAWLEALEASTAPRVRPPSGVDATCPGDPEGDPVHVAGDLAHHAPLVPAEVDVLLGAAELLLWAAERELSVPAPVAQAFASSESTHFVALRFAAPSAEAWTPVLRVSLPLAAPVLPLALTAATDVEIGVTLFAFAEGRAALAGSERILDASRLAFDAESATTDLAAVRSALLGDARSWLVESSGHRALVEAVALPGGESIPSLVDAYFERADLYGAATGDPAACAAVAASVIEQPDRIGAACPRADLGVVDDGPPCVEAPQDGEADPELLRCGGDADDLALALAGLRGEDSWLTRIALRIAPQTLGTDEEVSVAPGPEVEPLLEAGSIDLSQCGEGGAGGAGAGGGEGSGGQDGAGPTGGGPGPSSAAGVGSGSGAVTYIDVPVQVYDVTCGCTGEYVIVDYVEVPEDDAPEDGSYYAQDGDDCGGETSESYETGEVEESRPAEDDCGGDTSDTSAESDDGCSGETSDTSAGSDEGCSGETSDTSDDGGGDDGDDGGDDGGGDDGDDGSGDDGADSGCGCDESSVAAAAARGARRPAVRKALRARPKLSVMTLGLLALLAPLRRLTRPRRGG